MLTLNISVSHKYISRLHWGLQIHHPLFFFHYIGKMLWVYLNFVQGCYISIGSWDIFDEVLKASPFIFKNNVIWELCPFESVCKDDASSSGFIRNMKTVIFDKNFISHPIKGPLLWRGTVVVLIKEGSIMPSLLSLCLLTSALMQRCHGVDWEVQCILLGVAYCLVAWSCSLDYYFCK